MVLKTWRQGAPRSPDAAYYRDLFRDLVAVREIMQACDVAVEMGEDFYAEPLTFDDVRLPARLYQKGTFEQPEDEEEGEDPGCENPPPEFFRIYVPGAPGRNKHWTIPEFYAAHVAKRTVEHLPRGLQMTWGLRALYEGGALGNIVLPPVRTVRLPDSKAKKRTALYHGFILLVRLRLLYNPAETEHPYSYDFIHDWCGIESRTTVSRGLRWLRENEYIRIVRRVSNPGRADTLYYDLAAPSVSSLARDRDAEGLIGVFRDFDSAVREEALVELIKLGPAAVEPLIVALADEDEEVKRSASEALIRISGPAVQPLISALSHTGEDIRTEVVRLLGAIGGDAALEALLGVLEEDIEVQREAIEALAYMRDKRAIEPLRRIQEAGIGTDTKRLAGEAADKILGMPRSDW